MQQVWTSPSLAGCSSKQRFQIALDLQQSLLLLITSLFYDRWTVIASGSTRMQTSCFLLVSRCSPTVSDPAAGQVSSRLRKRIPLLLWRRATLATILWCLTLSMGPPTSMLPSLLGQSSGSTSQTKTASSILKRTR